MTAYLKRLLASSAAYQASSVLSAALAVITLPLYTRHLSTADYGYAETLLTFIILTSIVLRLGISEALVRFWFDDDDRDRRVRLARATTAWVLLASTVATSVAVAAAGPLARLILDSDDAGLMRLGLLGLWAFTNLEVAYSLLRVEERRREYVIVGVTNVLLTVALTVTLVIGFDGGARGYVLGNYGASTLVLLGLWFVNRDLIGWHPRRPGIPLGPLVRFGAPTIAADATVFALNVVDRAYLLRVESPAAAGVYAVSVKLATAVIVAVRGFQAAWPPLAYSVTDDAEARRLYAFVTTAYVAFTGMVVAGIALLGRWMVRLLAAPDYFEAHVALPWVALGWALYGLNLVFLTIAGRAKVTTRNFPAAGAGLMVNVLVLVALVPSLGIRGAGIALCAAYLVMLVAIHLLTRHLFTVPFEWARLTQLVVVMGGMAVAGELLLPDAGLGGFATRTAVLGAIPLVLLGTGIVSAEERAGLRSLVAARRASRAASRSGAADPGAAGGPPAAG